MTKRVLSVGQCGPDTYPLRRLIEGSFDARLESVDTGDDALAALRAAPCDLVLVNRKLDIDYSDGLEVIRQIKADPALAGVPCMLVTNYAEHQQVAAAAGAEPGFGKSELGLPETREKLARFLD
jgi:two-component system chemotaxis response regulator CheY